MSDEQLEDLKQFIDGRISQATSGLATKKDIENLRKEMHDGFAGVGEAIEHINVILDQHEERITKLETKAA